MKLADWKEGGYKYSDVENPDIGTPRGEILLGGPGITNGYLIDPDHPDEDLAKKNKEEFTTDENGIRWFHTGDIGAVHPDGTLSIIDRKKDLVKLQNGEYVALSKVEGVVKLCALVENAMVHVNPKMHYCTVLVCPMMPVLQAFLESKKKPTDAEGIVAACDSEELKKEILSQISSAAKGKLAKFEIPQKVHIVTPDKVWTPENDLLTAAQKLKRKPIISAHQADIDALYA